MCTRQFAAVISSCIAELVAPMQGESLLESEKKLFKTKFVADFRAWRGHFWRVGGFFWCCHDQVRSQEVTASAALVNRPHHGLGFIWMDFDHPHERLWAARMGHAKGWRVGTGLSFQSCGADPHSQAQQGCSGVCTGPSASTLEQKIGGLATSVWLGQYFLFIHTTALGCGYSH